MSDCIIIITSKTIGIKKMSLSEKSILKFKMKLGESIKEHIDFFNINKPSMIHIGKSVSIAKSSNEIIANLITNFVSDSLDIKTPYHRDVENKEICILETDVYQEIISDFKKKCYIHLLKTVSRINSNVVDGEYVLSGFLENQIMEIQFNALELIDELLEIVDGLKIIINNK